jgi:hypothetical protein
MLNLARRSPSQISGRKNEIYGEDEDETNEEKAALLVESMQEADLTQEK